MSSLKLSIDLFKTLEDPEAKRRMVMQIRSIRYAIEKKSLEDALVAFRKVYHREPSSLAALRPLASSDSRELASIADEGQSDRNEENQLMLSETFPFQYEPESRSIIP